MDLLKPGRARALLAAVLVAAATIGVAACGSDDSKPAARSTTTAPAVSVAKTPVQVAATKRGAVAYRSVGSGPPLVLVMGFGSSMEDWGPTFVDALAKTHRVVIFHNAGIGESAPTAPKLSISKMADQTSALIESLKLGKTDVLGWSMGGMISQALTARHPDQVRRLVLAATWPGNGDAREDRSKAPPADATAEEFNAALFPDDQTAAVKLYGDGLASYADRSAVPDALYGEQRAAINGWLAGKEPAGKRFTATSVPTLVAGGGEDRFNPIYNTRRLAKLVEDAELEVYDDAGHGFLFQPDTKVVARVNAFLSEED